MNKFDRLTEGLLEARKAKSTVETNLLSTLLGEVQAEMKRSDKPSAVIVEQIAKKFKKNIESMKQNDRTDEELFILKPFLPEELDESEIIEQLNLLNLSEMTTFGQKMGTAMRTLKGKVDGNTLGRIIREKF